MISVAMPGFLQAERFFHGDFIERVHGHFDIGGVHAASVRLNPDLHVVIDDPFDGYEYFHGEQSPAFFIHQLCCTAPPGQLI